MTGQAAVIAVRIPAGMLASFRGHGWVAVEILADEASARDRFHALRPAFYGLKASAVLLRAIVTPDHKIEPQKAMMCKDAEFWRLRDIAVGMASRDQINAWSRKAEELIALEEANALARRPGLQRAKSRSVPPTAVAAGLVLGVVGIVALAATLARSPSPQTARGSTILISDPRDPSVVIEYEMGADGSRRPLRRLSREQMQGGAQAEASATSESRPKTLAEGINAFLRFRQ